MIHRYLVEIDGEHYDEDLADEWPGLIEMEINCMLDDAHSPYIKVFTVALRDDAEGQAI